jgi:amidase
MTHSVRDAATMLGVMAGVDTSDPKTYESIDRTSEDYTQYLDTDGLDGARLGIARDFFGGNKEVDEEINEAIEMMSANGAEIIDPIIFPEEFFDSIGDIYSTISDLEFKNYLNEYLDTYDEAPVESLEEVIEISDDPSFPINERVLERLKEAQSRGEFTNNFYQRTLKTGPEMVRRVLAEPIESNDLDALVSPTSSCPPEPVPSEDDVDYQIDYDVPDEINYNCEDVPFRTSLANISGYPEVSVPAGFTSGDLPTSISFLRQTFDEPTLLKIAYSYEQKSMHRRAPEKFGPLSNESQ